jgi:hypothetical protein
LAQRGQARLPARGEQQVYPRDTVQPQPADLGLDGGSQSFSFPRPARSGDYGTLEILDGEREEDTYISEKGNLWTYITVEGAMCHLLRDELPMFYTLYNGFVSHVSPTNAWMEGIDLKGRIGTGDMPHSRAAAEYVTIHRSSLVYENEGKLELCWGIQPEWLPDGAKLSAKRALTQFGRCEFSLQRFGATLALDYRLASEAGYPVPEEVRFHIPKLKEALTSMRVNGETRMLSPGESVIKLS